MNTDFVLPKWNPPPPSQRETISDDVYLSWLAEQRVWLIRDGRLKRIQSDPARCPVDQRFVLD